MKKLKYLLILSLIAILVGGVMIGCAATYSVDRNQYYQITFCANGGTLKKKPERVIYVPKSRNALVPEPGVSRNMLSGELIVEAPRPENGTDRVFLCWAVAECDEDGNPVYVNAPQNPRYDGGVWFNKDGRAVVKASETDEEVDENSVAGKDAAVEQKYYSYLKGESYTEWNFDTDRISSDLVLVAVWTERSYFIVADKDDSTGEWEDLSAFNDSTLKVESPLFEEYKDRLQIINNINNKLELKPIGESYEALRNPNRSSGTIDHTLIDYYTSPDLSEGSRLTGTQLASQLVQVIYYNDIVGDYDVVTNYTAFRTSVQNNRNIYVKNDLTVTGDTTGIGLLEPKSGYYGGEIIGNGFKLSNYRKTITQTQKGLGENNYYAAIFGDLNGANISDFTIEIVAINFRIDVDSNNPTFPEALKELNKDCRVAVFAKSIKNTTLKNVKVIVESYEVTHTATVEDYYQDADGNWVYGPIPNNYEAYVTWSEWASGIEGRPEDGNVFEGECEVTFVEAVVEE